MAPADVGALSLVPPLLAIVLAITTRKPVLSLFLGVWSGAIIASRSIEIATMFEWITAALGESIFHVKIVFIVSFLGASAAFIYRLGGALALTQFASTRLDSRRKVGLMTWVLGIIWSFGDYSNTAVVGVSMRDVADKMRISREKLSYIVDSTAAPVATFGLSSWIVYQLSMIEQGYEAAGIAESASSAFSVFPREHLVQPVLSARRVDGRRSRRDTAGLRGDARRRTPCGRDWQCQPEERRTSPGDRNEPRGDQRRAPDASILLHPDPRARCHRRRRFVPDRVRAGTVGYRYHRKTPISRPRYSGEPF